jgi:peptidoglycan/LPS O-acetylase OafA/YrhL
VLFCFCGDHASAVLSHRGLFAASACYLPSIWGHTWSLAVEEQFYAVLPLLLLLLVVKTHSSKRPFAIVPPLALVLAVGCLALRIARHPTSIDDIRYAFHFRVDALFAGVALGYVYHFRPRFFAAWSRWWLPIVSAAAMILLWVFEKSAVATPYLLTLNILGFVALVWWAVMRTSLRARWLERVGVCSYSIYLWHLFAGGTILSLGNRFVWFAPLSFALYVVAAVAMGSYMHRIIEAKALQFRDRVFPSNPLSHKPAPMAWRGRFAWISRTKRAQALAGHGTAPI